MTKRVFITVNPGLVAGKRFMTVRSLVTALDNVCDLYVLPISAIDFKTRKLTAYRRIAGGKFKRLSNVTLKADLWINYSDGYYLDHRELGYKRRIDFLDQQLNFYEQAVHCGAVSRVVNSPQSERNTLKDWFVKLDCQKLAMIPTVAAANSQQLNELFRRHRCLVAKPIWGGAGAGVIKIDSAQALDAFLAKLPLSGEHLDDFVFQTYYQGPEKRLWFTGDQFAGARICYGRKTPWSAEAEGYHAAEYGTAFGAEFATDLKRATRVWQLSGLSIGSVDFIGDKINEINGCGTTFISYQNWNKIVDARKQLVSYALRLVAES